MAKIAQAQYERGKGDGLNGAAPINPWAPPASEWTPDEKQAYLLGYNTGRAERTRK